MANISTNPGSPAYPQDGGARLGWMWLVPGVSRMNGMTLLYISFVSIGLLVFLNTFQPYILSVMLDVPKEDQGKVIAGMGLIHETVLLLAVGPFGALADRIGRSRVLVIGYVLLTIGYLLYPFATSVAMLTGFRAVFAVGAAAILSAYTTLLADFPQERSRGKFIAMSGILNGLGLLLLVSIGGHLTGWLGDGGLDPVWAGRATVAIISLTAVVSIFVVNVGLRGARPDVGHERRPLLQLLAEGMRAARNPRLALAYGCAFAARGDVVVIGMYLALWAQQAGMDAGMTAGDALARGTNLFAIVAGQALLVAPLLGILNDRIDRVTGIGIGMSLGFVGYMAFGLMPDPLDNYAYVAAVLLGVGQISSILAGQTLVGQEADPKIAGSIMGAFNFFGAAGTLVGATVGGLLFDYWMQGGPFVMMGIANGLLVIAALAIRLTGR